MIAVNDGRVVTSSAATSASAASSAPGRLRQHLHLRAPRLGLRDLPRAQAAHGAQAPDPPRAAPRPARGKAPTKAAATSRHAAKPAAKPRQGDRRQPRPSTARTALKERLFAHPTRAPLAASTAAPIQLGESLDDARQATTRAPIGLDPEGLRGQEAAQGRARHRRHDPRPHRQGRGIKAHLRFEIRPAGDGAPRIDPKPILDGWKLLESTAIYRAAGKNPFFGDGRQDAVDRPDPADEQGGADRSACSPTRASRSTSAAATTSRPARSTAACSRRSSSSPPRGLKPDGLGAEVRPQLT